MTNTMIIVGGMAALYLGFLFIEREVRELKIRAYIKGFSAGFQVGKGESQ